MAYDALPEKHYTESTTFDNSELDSSWSMENGKVDRLIRELADDAYAVRALRRIKQDLADSRGMAEGLRPIVTLHERM